MYVGDFIKKMNKTLAHVRVKTYVTFGNKIYMFVKCYTENIERNNIVFMT